MMNVFEKIREKLEETKNDCGFIRATVEASSYCKALSKAIEIVNQVEQEHNNGWIPCSERLPEKHKDVLVTDGNDMMVWNLVEDYSGYSWEDEYGVWNDFERVIYWRPLPKPYKESDTNGN